MMKSGLFVMGLLLVGVNATAHAEGLFSNFQHKSEPTSDAAELVTLEAKGNEMFPKVSPDGKYLLALVTEGNEAWISRRSIENGDHLNTVTNDIAALGSFAWFGDQVTFSSSRTGHLSLWKKPASGEGLMRREMQLTGELQDMTLLQDGSLIATRLLRGYKQRHGLSSDHFKNWDVGGLHSAIVRIFPDGSEKRLSDGVSPAVSADGTQVVFSIKIGKSVHLFMMNIDGTSLTQLTDTRSVDVQPVWSHDGKWIVFTSNRRDVDAKPDRKDHWNIWAISSEGTHLRQLTQNKGRDGSPSVAEDGSVYFHSDRRVDKLSVEAHQIRSAPRGFHIWKIQLPEE